MKCFFLLLMFILFSCHRSEKSQRVPIDTVHIKNQERKTTPKFVVTENNMPEQWEDTVRLNVMMKDILAYAGKNKAKSSYKTKLSLWNFEYNSEAELNYGKLFSSDQKYLIIYRKFYGNIIAVDAFELNGNKFLAVFSQPVMNNTFLNSGIQDINGDGLKDYFIHFYPSSGCCRRDLYDVYIYQKSNHRFTNQIRFINPTFSPREKIIRGISYGQPGNVNLYKFSWNGSTIDTIEYISPDSTGKKYYLTKTDKSGETGKVLSVVPQEYHKIKSYDWFEGKY
jgi:hypothetical protein